MGKLIQDIRYGARTLVQRPLFTLAAVLTLGLAVGANTSIFSLFNAAFLQPLPFAQPEPGNEKAAVLSFALWQGLLGGSPDVLQQTIRLDGEVYTIVGVLPRQANFPPGADVWVPAVFPDEMMSREYTFLNAIARIRPGLTLEQAQSEMTALAEQLEQEYPQHQSGRTTRLVGLRESLSGDRRRPLLLLLGALGMVLLIACANTANLLLARSAARGREMAVRAALGAGRARLARQLLTECLLLAGWGGALGLLLAWAGSGMMPVWLPSSIAGDTEKSGNF